MWKFFADFRRFCRLRDGAVMPIIWVELKAMSRAVGEFLAGKIVAGDFRT